MSVWGLPGFQDPPYWSSGGPLLHACRLARPALALMGRGRLQCQLVGFPSVGGQAEHLAR